MSLERSELRSPAPAPPPLSCQRPPWPLLRCLQAPPVVTATEPLHQRTPSLLLVTGMEDMGFIILSIIIVGAGAASPPVSGAGQSSEEARIQAAASGSKHSVLTLDTPH